MENISEKIDICERDSCSFLAQSRLSGEALPYILTTSSNIKVL